MSTEPSIKSDNIWASVKGALLSTAVVFLLIVCSLLFTPSTPEDDGHIMGAIMVLGTLPLVFGIVFLYFLILSAKENRPFKFALLIQSIVIFPFVVLVFLIANKASGISQAYISSFYTFGIFSLVIGLGSWAWSKE